MSNMGDVDTGDTIGRSFAAMAARDLARLVALCVTFPTLLARNVRDVSDLKAIAAAPSGEVSVAAREAARFCLLVWDDSIGRVEADYRFNLRSAWGAWDKAHRAAWQAWTTAPWFA